MNLPLRVHTELRSLARRLGVIRLLSRARSVLARDDAYEAKLRMAMESEIRPGDVVWDVGANLGLYTKVFATCTGPTGIVCAFEPAPQCFETLRGRTETIGQVRAHNFALGASEGTLPFNVSTDPLAATHSFAAVEGAGGTIPVRVAKPDALVASGEAPAPNVMKIDVEGFEEEVVDGATELLRRPELRAVFIEVHFGILEQRGKRQAPATIVEKLRAAGLNTRWVDASHLVATRD